MTAITTGKGRENVSWADIGALIGSVIVAIAPSFVAGSTWSDFTTPSGFFSVLGVGAGVFLGWVNKFRKNGHV